MTSGLAEPRLIAVLISLTAALTIVALSLAWEWWTSRRRHRDFVGRVRAGEGAADERAEADLFHDFSEEERDRLQSLLDRLPRGPELGRLLDQAGLGWGVARLYALIVGAALVGGLVGYAFTGAGFIALPSALLAAAVPYLYVKWKKKKRLEAFEEAFPDAIDLLGRSVRAGHAFATGLQMVADEMPDPMGREFRQVFEEQKFGLPMADALVGLSERIDLSDVRIFVTAVLIQREVGGNLAEILDNLSNTIRERFTIKRQVRVYTAQGRFTGYLLAALPFVVAFLIFMLNPEYMSVLWTEPVGRMLIMVALMLQLIGYFVIRRIVDIEI
ncbi:MAG: type II secretion system F family protein [Gemmatimonadota bacterium]|nr:type II secretion system F family protein [Gemmatimonadota bacterium]